MTTSNNKQQSIITEKENSLVELTAKVEALEKENETIRKEFERRVKRPSTEGSNSEIEKLWAINKVYFFSLSVN